MSESPQIQFELVRQMEGNLARHGDSFQGVGWTKKKEFADLRYRVMLEMIRDSSPATLLDLGCGAAHLQDYIAANELAHLAYSGLDLSAKYLKLCRTKHPQLHFYQADILDPDASIPMHDYVVMNGLFNYKADFSFDEMWAYCQRVLEAGAKLARRGFAFNVMSKHVDWERNDLFHLPIGMLTDFLANRIGREFVVRHDYGLFEYTTYVYSPRTA